jgi:hypothetical protein
VQKHPVPFCVEATDFRIREAETRLRAGDTDLATLPGCVVSRKDLREEAEGALPNSGCFDTNKLDMVKIITKRTKTADPQAVVFVCTLTDEMRRCVEESLSQCGEPWRHREDAANDAATTLLSLEGPLEGVRAPSRERESPSPAKPAAHVVLLSAPLAADEPDEKQEIRRALVLAGARDGDRFGEITVHLVYGGAEARLWRGCCVVR